jgi:hypothetical protein
MQAFFRPDRVHGGVMFIPTLPKFNVLRRAW